VSERRQLLWFTLIHPLVDACSVSVLVAGGMTWGRAMAYNAIAFALQLPLGVALDFMRPEMTSRGFWLGTCAVSAAAFAAALGFAGWGTLGVACMGNALFHLTAGKRLLEGSGGRSGPMGFFISTGALGLMAGQVWMKSAAAICLPAFAAALAACLVAKNRAENGTAQNYAENGAAKSEGARVVGGLLLLGLFVLIAWRSWAALAATSLTMAAGVGFAAAGAAATWGGKATGGYLAERLGRWQVTAASVCGSAALAFLCSPNSAAAWMALLFVSQLATGPVVSLVYDRTRRIGGGTAFGLNCLGLFAGVGG
jgi:hypothetical protein